MQSYGQAAPLRVAVQHGSPDILHTLLRYGASPDEGGPLGPALIEILLSRLSELGSEAALAQLLVCLRLLLRSLPSVCVRVPGQLATTCGIQRVSVQGQYPGLSDRGLLPAERVGLRPPELKHLARCRVRECLGRNWALPHGIRRLQIPRTLQDYVDLLVD